ncbi:MAG TPA: archease [Syntrophorhabdaceae bacterium]|nr:archease [Syntrophorhabdaceae bacterium]
MKHKKTVPHNMDTLRYRLIDHEADVGLEVYGKTLEELFSNAAYGVFQFIVDAEGKEPEKGKRIDIEGNGELLINFLNELLYLWDTEGFIPKECSLKISDNKLTGTVVGCVFDPEKCTIKQEVKAVTYHKFYVKGEDGRYKAQIILDV